MMATVTQLSDAVEAGDVRTVQALLGREPGLASSRDADGRSLVLLACTGGHRRVLDALLAAGADLDVFDAAALGYVNQLEILLGLDPTVAADTTAGGVTALHLAARFGHLGATRRLLDAGADPAALDADGHTPADLARAGGHVELGAILRSA